MDKTRESVFQQAIVDDLAAHGWPEGKSEHCHRELAFYREGPGGQSCLSLRLAAWQILSGGQ